MSKIFKQVQAHQLSKRYNIAAFPIKIEHFPEAPSRITFDSGVEIESTCLSCVNKYCINYTNEELKSIYFNDFPHDTNNNVCPINAIEWDINSDFPHIKSEICFSCGLCASRCPVGAIYLTKDTAIINTKNINYIDNTDIKSHKAEIDKFQNATKTGKYLDESDVLFSLIYNKTLETNANSQFPNLITRNLLIQLGLNTLIRRKGDVNLRMDGVFNARNNPKIKGVIEIEFGKDVLDSPRNILDNLAVLSSRHNYQYNDLIPLVVSFNLPNIRTEYWRVIKDISNVLNIKIQSFTIGTLMLLLWNQQYIDFSQHNFYVDCDNPSINSTLSNMLNRKINLSNFEFSITAPNK